MNSKFELVKCPLCKKNNYEIIINPQKKKSLQKIILRIFLIVQVLYSTIKL